MKTCAQYIAEAKKLLGDPKMSDRVFGETLGGYTQPTIHKAKTGNMPDSIAVKVAHICSVPAGEVLMVARLEREKDPEIKAHLVEWAGKVFGLLPVDEVRPEAFPALGVLAAGHEDTDVSIFKRKSRQVSRAASRSTLAETEGFEPSIHFWRMLP